MAIDTNLGTQALIREITVGERAGFNTTQHLEKAKEQAIERNFQDVFIVDIDAHHKEYDGWQRIMHYIEDPIIRHRADAGFKLSSGKSGTASLQYSYPDDQGLSGRLFRYQRVRQEKSDGTVPHTVAVLRREMEAIGIDYQIIFPNGFSTLGLHPDPEIEVALTWAYSRWLTEEILPHDPKLKVMIYLPFNSPEYCPRAIEAFGDKPGVVGFMTLSPRYRPVHHNAYMRTYAMLQERGLPLGFHSSFNRTERMFEGMNKFISAHAIGFVLSNLIHVTNMVINGIPERFPKLKIVWIESGLAWIPFLMQRLDNEYLMRTSEAPLLKKKPSEYMAENFYYSTQPMETDNLEALELTLKMMNAEKTLMFSSDFPHWDFNLPSMIWDLPFLSDQAKRNILGETARKVFSRLEATH